MKCRYFVPEPKQSAYLKGATCLYTCVCVCVCVYSHCQKGGTAISNVMVTYLKFSFSYMVKPLIKIKHAMYQRADYIQGKYVSRFAEDCSSCSYLR